MPGPLVAAAGAGLGSAIIGASASRSASNAQVGAAKDQMRLQGAMFDRTDKLQEQLFNDQQDQLLASRSENIDLAQGERNALASLRLNQLRSTSTSRNPLQRRLPAVGK